MQQKKSINLGFRGWMLVIYQFLAYMALMCFHNWPMNGLSEFYGGAQTITTVFTVASVLGIAIQVIVSRNIGKIKNIKALSVILGVIAMSASFGLMVIPPSTAWLVSYFIACLVIAVWCTFVIGILIGQWFPRRKGTVMGIATIAFPVGNALLQPFMKKAFATLPTTGKPDVFGAWLPFFILICVGILIGAIFVKDYPEQCGAYRDNDKSITPEVAKAIMERDIENKRTSVWTLGNTLKCPDFWFLTLPSGLLLAGSVGMSTQTAKLFVNYGIDAENEKFGLIMFGLAVFTIIGSYTLGVLDTKIGTRKAMMISTVLMVVAGILGIVNSLPCAIAALWVLGLFMGAASNFTVSSSVQYWRIEDFPNVFALVNPVANFLQALAPMVIAMLMFMNGAPDTTPPYIFVCVGGIVGTVMLALFKPERVKAYDDKYRAKAGKALDEALVGRK